MHLWTVTFGTLGPMESLPRLRVAAAETRVNTGYRHEGRHRAHERHCLFQYSLDGEGVFRDGAGEHRCPAGTGFLCRINDPATAYYFPPDARGPWTFVFACFDGPAATALTAELVGRHGPLYRLPRTAPALRRLLAWQSRDRTRVELSAAEGASAVLDLLLALAAEAESARAAEPANQLVRLAQQTVRDRLDENLNVADLARALGVSREHLSRVFREEAGLTPARYIRREKMQLACHLLKESRLSAKEVAARLGFATAAHFSRVFKETVRMTPGEFAAAGSLPVVL